MGLIPLGGGAVSVPLAGAGAGDGVVGAACAGADVDRDAARLPEPRGRLRAGEGVVTAVVKVPSPVAPSVVDGDAAASVPRANNACALISTSLIARAPSPSAGTIDPFTMT